MENNDSLYLAPGPVVYNELVHAWIYLFQNKIKNVTKSDLHFYPGDTTGDTDTCDYGLGDMLSHYTQVYLDKWLEEEKYCEMGE